MESLRRRIEDILAVLLLSNASHWLICRAVDRIMVEVENEITERQNQKGTTDEGNPQRELPL
jgi:hypothetical protein